MDQAVQHLYKPDKNFQHGIFNKLFLCHFARNRISNLGPEI